MASHGSEAEPGATVPRAPPLDARSRHLRRLAVRALRGGNRGHVGSTLSLIEILRVLYDDILSYRPDQPRWPGRDRCVLSKGHGCIALYALLADKGFFDPAHLDQFCRREGMLGGHPEAHKVPGVEASTGALGHGLPIAVGMAMAARLRGESHRVVCVMGDGEINEGSVWEAALIAGKHGLEGLTAIVDYNKLQSYGAVSEVQPLEPLGAKWEAFGFAVREVDGHDVDALGAQLAATPFSPGRPSMLIAHTVKGKGLSFAEGAATWHHKSRFAPDVLARMEAELATPGEPRA